MNSDPVTKLEWRLLYDEVKGLRADFKKHVEDETKERILVATSIAVLNTKAGFWGLLGGAISGVGVLFGLGK